jgi:Glycosyl hydrolases family 2, TIM barrel domain/Glycosyl hydrolases family 2, sugar binding domain/Glycosyl hydrolases family 2
MAVAVLLASIGVSLLPGAQPVPLRPVPSFQDAPAPGPPTRLPPASIPLRAGWTFLPDSHDVGLREGWFRGAAAAASWSRVTIPHDFNPIVSRASDAGEVGWYQLRFKGPQVSSGRSWNIAFESVRRHARVWLNGTEVGSNDDPYAPFRVPAKTLYQGGPNVLMVRVDDFRGPGTLPEDWWNWGGILGPVSLEPAAGVRLRSLGSLAQLGCRLRCGAVLVRGAAANLGPRGTGARLEVQVSGPSKTGFTVSHPLGGIASQGTEAFSFKVPLPRRPALWSPQRPSLYQVRVRALVGPRVEDQQTQQVGLRSVQVRRGILYLNGKRLWLHGAAIHEDLPFRGAALRDSDIKAIVAELRAVGANVTRAHYLLNERLLDALDAAGIMVWEQPPVDHADALLASAAGRDRALAMLGSTVLYSRSHPSVVVDSVGNELTPTPDNNPGTLAYLRSAITLARRINPTVPVALDIYCYPGFPAQSIYRKLDVLGISHYFGWYPGLPGHSIASFSGLAPYLRLAHGRYPQQALAISEFGAEALYNGSARTKGSYAFQANYVRQTLQQLDRLPFMNGAIYWTMREFAVGPDWRGGATLPRGIVPSGIHHKGLITYAGALKPAFGVASKLFRQPPPFVR